MSKKEALKEIKPPVSGKLFKEITERIVAKIKPEKIILFGSYAYGRPNKDSDLDLFIIKNTRLSSGERYAAVSDALYPRVIPMDFVVKTPREVRERLAGFDPFVKEVLSKGRVLYEK
jgi:uncharacterized protein